MIKIRNYKHKIDKFNFDSIKLILSNLNYHYDTTFKKFSKYKFLGNYNSIELEIWVNLEIIRFHYNGMRITPAELNERAGSKYKNIMKGLQPLIRELKENNII